MASVHPRKKSRKPVITQADICELVRTIQLEKNYTLAQIAEILRSVNIRGRGRPGATNRFEILDAAAKAKAEIGQYLQLAPRFHLGLRQLTNLVQRNRAYFEKKVRSYSKIRDL